MRDDDVLITGIGLLSSLGEGNAVHWDALTDPDFVPRIDRETFAPYPIHPLAHVDWDLQIPKRGDQRQMEAWQRTGVYAAGLALDDAGIKGDDALCETMDMIVAAGGGERDTEVDRELLLATLTSGDATDSIINEKLIGGLRPTLFLAQLSNLLAGNISIVHKVTGSSRTLMGEEAAGISAVQTAAARIRSGQSTHCLVGGAYSAAHPEFLLSHELGGLLHREKWKPVWSRAESKGGGLIPGSGGCFLVLEARSHAVARNARAYGVLRQVEAVNSLRGSRYDTALARMIERFQMASDTQFLAISAASGARSATASELHALNGTGNLVTRGIASAFGHLNEAQFPLAVAIAALTVAHRAAPAALDRTAEGMFHGGLDEVLATTVGHVSGEGMALVVREERTGS